MEHSWLTTTALRLGARTRARAACFLSPRCLSGTRKDLDIADHLFQVNLLNSLDVGASANFTVSFVTHSVSSLSSAWAVSLIPSSQGLVKVST